MLREAAAVLPRTAPYPFPADVVGDELPRADARRARPEIVVQFLTSARDFAEVAAEWNRLHDQCVTASVSKSWIWQFQWWQAYGADQPLRLLVALEGGEPVGVLALYIQTIEVMGTPVRLLRLVGSGANPHPDDLGPVIAPEREDETARKLADAALCVGEVDVIALSDIDPRSRFPALLERAAADFGCDSHRTTRCMRVFRNTRAALVYRLRRIWLPRLQARLLFRAAPELAV